MFLKKHVFYIIPLKYKVHHMGKKNHTTVSRSGTYSVIFIEELTYFYLSLNLGIVNFGCFCNHLSLYISIIIIVIAFGHHGLGIVIILALAAALTHVSTG